jgi:hypothetical protein
MLRVISDVHGNIVDYKTILVECEYSLHIGDLSFDYEFLGDLCHERNKVIPGNHDNHDGKRRYPHFLLNYGLVEHGGIKFFYLEGGFSIDQALRREREQLQIWPKTWWENEELPQDVLEDALRVYKETKPDILISHEPSRSIANKMGNNIILLKYGYDPNSFTTRTGETLERMVNAHAPKLHIFGHFHINFDQVINGCRYICQEELGYLDLYEDLSVRKFSYKSGLEYE